MSSLRIVSAKAPAATVRSILASAPKVERNRRSKSASRHCATTRVFTTTSLVSRANIQTDSSFHFETGATTGAYCTDEVPVLASGVTLLVR